MSLGLSGTVTMKAVANRNGMGVLSGQPLRLWKELSSMETMAAGALGFTQRIWDMQELADVESCLQEGLFGAGFEACITQGCDAESLDPAMKLALSHPKVYVSFGSRLGLRMPLKGTSAPDSSTSGRLVSTHLLGAKPERRKGGSGEGMVVRQDEWCNVGGVSLRRLALLRSSLRRC